MTEEERPEPPLDEPIEKPEIEVEDPIGDETDGEAEFSTETEDESKAETGEDDAEVAAEAEEEADDESKPAVRPRPKTKLERLQKILAQSGVASRRKAEEMIEQGRVQVNGKTVTELGTKADAGRDHIRVDGKLLQGAERLRYFVLNKPKGFVTTVKDPEGRPTVMQFFEKMRERLYPVGRLDYMSEGLLLVTNDGELANKLTRASAGVEKTYLVKVAGVPTESELDTLRAGIAIEKGKPGSGKVRTSPARIRQVRHGDNPWYEVVLIEGRNRELRKMFEEIGHFVEKIRRVGYGPLILDQEPGKLRELDEQELALLRKAADGTLRTPKAKEIRRRNIIDSLPPEKPAFKPRGARPNSGAKDYQPKRSFRSDRPVRGSSAPARFGSDRAAASPSIRPASKKDDRPASPSARFEQGSSPNAGFGSTPRSGPRPNSRPAASPESGPFNRPTSSKPYPERRADGRSFGPKASGARPSGARPRAGKSFGNRPAAGRSLPAKPAGKRPEAREFPSVRRTFAARPEATRRPASPPQEDFADRKPSKLHIEPVHESERSHAQQPGRPQTGRPGLSRPGTGGRSGADRFGTGRSGGARPGSKPDKFGGQAKREGGSFDGPGGGRTERPARSFTPRSGGTRPERNEGSGWKPKSGFGAKGQSSTGSKSGTSGFPKPGGSGFGKKISGFKGRPSSSRGNRPGSSEKRRP